MEIPGKMKASWQMRMFEMKTHTQVHIHSCNDTSVSGNVLNLSLFTKYT